MDSILVKLPIIFQDQLRRLFQEKMKGNVKWYRPSFDHIRTQALRPQQCAPQEQQQPCNYLISVMLFCSMSSAGSIPCCTYFGTHARTNQQRPTDRKRNVIQNKELNIAIISLSNSLNIYVTSDQSDKVQARENIKPLSLLSAC